MQETFVAWLWDAADARVELQKIIDSGYRIVQFQIIDDRDSFFLVVVAEKSIPSAPDHILLGEN